MVYCDVGPGCKYSASSVSLLSQISYLSSFGFLQRLLYSFILRNLYVFIDTFLCFLHQAACTGLSLGLLVLHDLPYLALYKSTFQDLKISPKNRPLTYIYMGQAQVK